MNKGNSKLIWN